MFKGTPPSGYVSHVLGAFVGLINGYFITGTVWFYLHQYGYPFGLIDGTQLSDTAQRLLDYLPPSIFGDHPAYLLGLLIVLLILSVWR